MKYGLTNDVIEKMISVFVNYPNITKVVLYGSRAKGNFKKGSDIDLALIGKDISIHELHKIELEMDELYLPYSFDLLIFNKVQNENLIEHINRIGIIIYNSDAE